MIKIIRNSQIETIEPFKTKKATLEWAISEKVEAIEAGFCHVRTIQNEVARWETVSMCEDGAWYRLSYRESAPTLVFWKSGCQGERPLTWQKYWLLLDLWQMRVEAIRRGDIDPRTIESCAERYNRSSRVQVSFRKSAKRISFKYIKP